MNRLKKRQEGGGGEGRTTEKPKPHLVRQPPLFVKKCEGIENSQLAQFGLISQDLRLS